MNNYEFNIDEFDFTSIDWEDFQPKIDAKDFDLSIFKAKQNMETRMKIEKSEAINYRDSHFCKLLDGRILPYFMRDQNDTRLHESPERAHLNLKYIGQGVIYMINGVLQNDDRLMHFYTKED